MQPNGLRQVEARHDVKDARGENVWVTAADVEDVEGLPVAVEPGAGGGRGGEGGGGGGG